MTIDAPESSDLRHGTDLLDVLAEWLLYVSAALIVAGLLQPSLHRDELIGGTDLTVIDLIRSLYQQDHQMLASLLVLFSIVFPLLKTLVAAVVFRLGHRASRQMAHLLQFLGKWSMLDVFLAAVLISFSELATLFSLEAERGLWFFAAGVVLNNLATARLSFSRAS